MKSGTADLARSAKALTYIALCAAVYCGAPAQAQSILPARPDAIGGGNPLEGLGRADDPNPSRASDFPDLNTTTPTPTPDANAPADSLSFPANTKNDPPGPPPDSSSNDAPPIDPNLTQQTGALGQTPGAQEALKKAQDLARQEAGPLPREADAREQKPDEKGMFEAIDEERAARSSAEMSFFKVAPDTPVKSALVDIREGRYEQALYNLKNMYAKSPTAIEMEYLMGVAAVMLRRNSEAEQHYQTVINYNLAPLKLKQLAQKGLDKLRTAH
jgi:hypothetical protein